MSVSTSLTNIGVFPNQKAQKSPNYTSVRTKNISSLRLIRKKSHIWPSSENKAKSAEQTYHNIDKIPAMSRPNRDIKGHNEEPCALAPVWLSATGNENSLQAKHCGKTEVEGISQEQAAVWRCEVKGSTESDDVWRHSAPRASQPNLPVRSSAKKDAITQRNCASGAGFLSAAGLRCVPGLF